MTKNRTTVWDFVQTGDDLGAFASARLAERPKVRPDFGLGDPARDYFGIFLANFFRVTLARVDEGKHGLARI